MTKAQIESLVEEKIEEWRGKITRLVAFGMVYKDLKIKNKNKNKNKKTKKEEIKMENEKKENSSLAEIDKKMALTVHDESEAIPVKNNALVVTHYPSEAEILFLIKRRKFVKEKLIDDSDKVNIAGTMFLKKSAWRKYINAFGISIDVLSKNVIEKGEDVIAFYCVKAIAPNGQFVVADGTKAKSEYWSEKHKNHGSYTLHNLKATARTRAINIAVSDLVGYGETSAEEIKGNIDNK